MPPPDKDYSKGITFSPHGPSLCDDGWLLIGSMSARPMKGRNVKFDYLYYTSLSNSKNMAWGEKKEACELADHIGNDGTTLTLKFESWIPSQEERRNKHELPRAIARKADEYFLQMTSRSEIDDSAPKTVEDAIRILTSELGLDIHKLDYIHGVSPAHKLVLAAIAQEHPGIDVRTTHFFKRLQEEGHAPQDSDPRPQIIGPSARSFPTQDAQHQATGPGNIKQEKTPEVTDWLRGVKDPTTSKSRSSNTIIDDPDLPAIESYDPPIPPDEQTVTDHDGEKHAEDPGFANQNYHDIDHDPPIPPEQRMVTNLNVAPQPDGEAKGPRVVDQDGALVDQHTGEDTLSHGAQPTLQNIANNLAGIQVAAEASTPSVSSTPLASPIATASGKRRRKFRSRVRGFQSPVSSVSDSSDE